MWKLIVSGNFYVSRLKVFFDSTSRRCEAQLDADVRVAAGLYVRAGNSIIQSSSPHPFGPMNVVRL